MSKSATDFGKTNLDARGMDFALLKAGSLIAAEVSADVMYRELDNKPEQFKAYAEDEIKWKKESVEKLRKNLDSHIRANGLNRMFVMQKAMEVYLAQTPQILSGVENGRTLDA